MRTLGTRSRIAAAVAASVALHAAIIALLLLRAPSPDLAPRREEIAVELIPAPPLPAPTPAPAPGPPPSVSRRAEPTPPQPGGARAPRPGAPATGGAPPRSAPVAPDELEAWFDAHGIGAEGRRERERERLSVAPPKELLDDAARAAEEDRNPGASVKRRIDDLIAEMKARDLSRYPDTSWTELRDALADGFAARPGAPGGQAGLGSALGQSATAYLDTARRFAERGSPLGDDPSAAGIAAADKAAVAGVSAEGNRDREALQAGVDRLAASGPPGAGGQPWTSGLVAVVEIEQDAKGAVARARLIRRSGTPAYDRLVVAQARRLLGRALAPRLAGTRTVWAFATELAVSLPAPALGIGFDASFKPTGLGYPLKRTTRTRIELLSVRRQPGEG
jgi:hypothetical protein